MHVRIVCCLCCLDVVNSHYGLIWKLRIVEHSRIPEALVQRGLHFLLDGGRCQLDLVCREARHVPTPVDVYFYWGVILHHFLFAVI